MDHDGHRGPRRGSDELADRAAEDVDRSAAESDQDLSDTDQTLSDSDQEQAEQDQTQSDADQFASDRDQTASDRDLASHPSSEDLKAAHAASEVDRARTTARRETGTRLRAGSMFGRAAIATKRDELGALRDAQAALRDRAAELRDESAAELDRALGWPGGRGAMARDAAAEDRERAASDRARAAEDRRRAAEDRDAALAALEQAQLDDLTGFYRPGLGLAILQREIDRARRTKASLVFAYCDVDGLKRVNDSEGHAAGDDLLQSVATAMRSRLRSYDPVVRMGGDEFVCALPDADLDQAAQVVGDMGRSLTATRPGASMSFGLSALAPGDTAATLIKRSDDAMRETKGT
jgi:diguanylate cyclase (GGDEF)-like protein